MSRVVVFDPEPTSYRITKQLLGGNHRVGHHECAARALDYARTHHPEIILLNLEDTCCDTMDTLARLVRAGDVASVIALIDSVELRRVVDAVQRGACDVVARPFTPRDVQRAITRALARNQALAADQPHLPIPEIVGMSEQTVRLRRSIQQLAGSAAPIIVTGESGVGKELVANALHRLSPAASGRFVARNCGALPETLLEAELFGTERGAYTDAVSRAGAFELADGGTLFLDEIGELSLAAQTRLLRALETGRVHRVGGTRLRATSARIVAATNRNLKELVRTREFRADLYYRINVVPITVAPLRERPLDIPALARHFVDRLAPSVGREPVVGFTERALERLSGHDWPGNVRELRNVIWRALALSGEAVIREEELIFD